MELWVAQKKTKAHHSVSCCPVGKLARMKPGLGLD